MEPGRGLDAQVARSLRPLSVRRRELILLAAALGLRLAALPLAPRWGYLHDHVDSARWGLQAVDHGPLSLYRQPPDAWPALVYDGQAARRVWQAHRRDYNYGPLTAYCLWASGALFAAVSPDRLINTVPSRAAFAVWGVLGDLLLAWGAARLAERLRPGSFHTAFVFVLFAPAFAWNAVVWGQWDSPVLAAAAWMLYAMVEGRWLAAGALYAVAAALKPQALAFLPLWAFAAAARPAQALRALAFAVFVLFFLALPVTLDTGLAWLDESFIRSASQYRGYTTLMAFNLWYADALASGSRDARALLLGLPKARWGDVLLMGGLLVSFAAAVRRWARPATTAGAGPDRLAAGLLLWAVVSLTLAVMLPTRVHERYLLVPLPFLVAAGTVWRDLRVPAIVLNAVALAQVTWPLWWRPRASNLPLEWALTCVALGTATVTVARAFRLPPQRESQPPE